MELEEAKEEEYNEEVKAKKDLKACRKTIEQEKPNKSDVASTVASFLCPSNKTDWKRIKYYKRNLTKTIKENFKKYLTKEPMKLKEAGPHAKHNDNTLGIRWHRLLSNVLSKEKVEGEELAAKELVQRLQEQFGVKLFDYDFLLYGYVYNKEEKAPNIYLWHDAEADAIGWYYDEISKRNKFVIVEWKVSDLLAFWTKPTTYGMYLHQGLVYARLLQLHMKLEYLPPIMLAAECKEAVEREFWSTKLPKPPLVIQPKMPFKPSLNDGPVDEEMLLKDVFADGAKVKDFLKVLEYGSLQVRRNGEEM